jgi:DNA mismatch endonuclease (patch repair protein)
MPDVFGKEVRSRIMRRIKGRNTKPELKVRSFLHKAGLRFRIHRGGLPGKPDIVLPRFRAVVFVQGCFWHQHPGCKDSGIPLSNRRYWGPKLKRTAARDIAHRALLAKMGWHVEAIWECQVTDQRLAKLVRAIKRKGISDARSVK